MTSLPEQKRQGDALARLVIEAARSPRLVEALRRDPDTLLAEAGLSAEEQDAVRRRDWPAICRLVARASPPRSRQPRDSNEFDGSGTLTVVGTGLRVGGQWTPEAEAQLQDADRLFTLGLDPVTRWWLSSQHTDVSSLAREFAPGTPREASKRRSVRRVLDSARGGARTCLVLYGHPGVFADLGHAAVRGAREAGLEARMLPGISAEDSLIADLGVDPARGRQCFEATDFLLRRSVDPSLDLVLWQIGAIGTTITAAGELWNRAGLEYLVEVLGRHYPADHRVCLYEATFSALCDAKILHLPLKELPTAPVTIVSTLYIPAAREQAINEDAALRLGLR